MQEASSSTSAAKPELGLCNALLSCFKPPQAAPVEAAVEPDYNGCYLLFTEARGGADVFAPHGGQADCEQAYD